MTDNQSSYTLLQEPAGGVPEIVDTLEGYRHVVEEFSRSTGPLAADAERASGFRYGHKNYLVQFKRAGTSIALLDPIALSHCGVNWAEFNNAIGEAQWVIHDYSQDVPSFMQMGLAISELFDTEHAARLLGLSRFGLSALTEHYLSLALEKEHSAADWSYRPLDRELRNYAALDVEVLIELRDALHAELDKTGKLEWARQDFAYMLEQGQLPRPEKPQPWRKVSHITKVANDPRGLAVVRSLWRVREKLAKKLDISPSLLLTDSAIIEAAQRKPRNMKAFSQIASLNQRVRVVADKERTKMFERYASVQREVKPKVWKEAISQALELPQSQLPLTTPIVDKDITSSPRSMRYWREHQPERFERLQKAKKEIERISRDTSTPTEILIKPSYVRNLCWQDRDDFTPDFVAEFLAMQGARPWQVDLLAQSLSGVII